MVAFVVRPFLCAGSQSAALQFLQKNRPQLINFNVGTGKGTSVLELINIFYEVTNIKIPYEFTDRRQGDNSTLVANNSKAFLELNWRPKRTLSEMCLDGWKWQSSNPKGYL